MLGKLICKYRKYKVFGRCEYYKKVCNYKGCHKVRDKQRHDRQGRGEMMPGIYKSSKKAKR